jgi:hypothetical protein
VAKVVSGETPENGGEATEVALARIDAELHKVLSRHATIRTLVPGWIVACSAVPLIPIWLTFDSIAGKDTNFVFDFALKVTIGISVVVTGAFFTQLFLARRAKQKAQRLEVRLNELESDLATVTKERDELKAAVEAKDSP